MPRKSGKGKRYSFIIKGRVNEALALSTLAVNTLVGADFDEQPDEEAFAISVEAVYSIQGMATNDGPIVFGLAHSDYTDAEIEEVIENVGSWDRGNLIAQERAKRKIRTIGTFNQRAVASDSKFNDGMPIKTTIKWNLITGATLKLWAFNKGVQMTTGAVITAEGHIWLRPR